MADDSLELNFDWVKSFLKNGFVLFFSVLTLFSLLFWLSSSLTFSLQINFLVQVVNLFPSFFWLLLAIASIVSGVLAYYEKYSWMFLPIIIWLLFTTAVVRTSNIPGLVNAATGEATLGPDLDPFLFLRNAIEISEGRNMGELDLMRYAPLGATSYIKANMMPWAIFYTYKFLNLFTDYSVTQAAIVAPVIFFLISVVGFFFFVYLLFSFKLSKKKALLGATIASFFYSFAPMLLHRTVAGIPELESLGLMWFWFAFLFFILAWRENFVNEGKNFFVRNKKLILYGLLAGLFTGAMSWTWGGYRYIYMTLALATFLAFFFNIDKKKNLLVFSSFLLTGLILELIKVKSIFSIISSFTDTGLALGVFLILLLNYLIFETKFKHTEVIRKIKEKTKLPENVLSIILFIIFGLVIMTLLRPSFVPEMFSSIFERLLSPFGSGRIGLTVAENRAPYFIEILSNFGGLVWLFLAGLVLMFYEAVKHFSPKKKWGLFLFFVIFVVTFVFSRISSGNVLNGENFISKFLYFGGLILFVIVLLVIYFKSYLKRDEKTLLDFSKINFASLVLISLSIWGIVSMRGAVRLFFIIAPIIIIVASYFFVKLMDYRKEKDDLGKLFTWILILVSLFILVTTFVNYSSTTVYGAKQTIPSSYNYQWHYAMDWVSKNTPEGSVFTHWWDYGYWVQTLGGRPTVSDGGHYINWWDHTVARYLLTTSKPETALSLMKTHNVSYLLIDSTDVGKYSAFSGIGSDETGKDRFSWIPVMPVDVSQTRELNSSTQLIYVGGQPIDTDIIYEDNDTPLFLPAQKAGLAGIVVEYSTQDGEISFVQPRGVFIYNNQRYDLPIRYIFYNGNIVDFGKGVNSLVRFIPGIEQTSGGMTVNPLGALVYLSEKTKDTLFAQLYLMDDPNNLYPTISIAHIEDDSVVKSLKSQGLNNMGSFMYYQGLRGPIKIWKVSYPENTLENEEFLMNTGSEGNWASLDNLEFTK
ncbi:MAG: hypothetical protein NUV46_01670 [Nanoarchaeota archaeon]|nr:hypothetical protein [Nanoarchaeota archaeon]